MSTLQQLEILVLVADRQNFRQAGDALGIAQPTVSRSIRLLEEEYGRTFFNRSARSAMLNAEGRDLVSRARRMLQLRDEIDRLLDGERSASDPPVRVGVPELVAAMWLEAWSRAVRRHMRGRILSATVASSQQLFGMLEAGSIDLAVLSQDLAKHNFSHIQLPTVHQAEFVSQLPSSDHLTSACVSGCEVSLGQIAAAISGAARVVLPRDTDPLWLRRCNLVQVDSHAAPPPLRYDIVHRGDRDGRSVFREVAMLGKDICDFTKWMTLPFSPSVHRL